MLHIYNIVFDKSEESIQCLSIRVYTTKFVIFQVFIIYNFKKVRQYLNYTETFLKTLPKVYKILFFQCTAHFAINFHFRIELFPLNTKINPCFSFLILLYIILFYFLHHHRDNKIFKAINDCATI